MCEQQRRLFYNVTVNELDVIRLKRHGSGSSPAAPAALSNCGGSIGARA
jgi:hypothetical protein